MSTTFLLTAALVTGAAFLGIFFTGMLQFRKCPRLEREQRGGDT